MPLGTDHCLLGHIYTLSNITGSLKHTLAKHPRSFSRQLPEKHHVSVLSKTSSHVSASAKTSSHKTVSRKHHMTQLCTQHCNPEQHPVKPPRPFFFLLFFSFFLSFFCYNFGINSAPIQQVIARKLIWDLQKAPRVKALFFKPDDLCSIIQTYKIKGGSQLLQIIL